MVPMAGSGIHRADKIWAFLHPPPALDTCWSTPRLFQRPSHSHFALNRTTKSNTGAHRHKRRDHPPHSAAHLPSNPRSWRPTSHASRSQPHRWCLHKSCTTGTPQIGGCAVACGVSEAAAGVCRASVTGQVSFALVPRVAPGARAFPAPGSPRPRCSAPAPRQALFKCGKHVAASEAAVLGQPAPGQHVRHGGVAARSAARVAAAPAPGRRCRATDRGARGCQRGHGRAGQAQSGVGGSTPELGHCQSLEQLDPAHNRRCGERR